MLSDVFQRSPQQAERLYVRQFQTAIEQKKVCQRGRRENTPRGKTVTRLAFVGAKHNSATGVSDNTCCAATRA